MSNRRQFLQTLLGGACIAPQARTTSATCSDPGVATTKYTLPSTTTQTTRSSLTAYATTPAWCRYVSAHQALLKNDGLSSRLRIATWHQTCCANWSHVVHGTPLFLPWHRVIVHLYEQLLRNHDPHPDPNNPLTVPYWDWEHDTPIPYQYQSAPFLPYNDGMQRSRNDDGMLGATQTSSLQTDVAGLLATVDFGDFSQQASDGAHARVHRWCGDYMADGGLAAFDPLFYIHHANMDRMWMRWKQLHNVIECPTAIAGTRFDFYNLAGDLTYVTFADLWHEEQLGYTYPNDPANHKRSFEIFPLRPSRTSVWSLPTAPPANAQRFIQFVNIDLTFETEQHRENRTEQHRANRFDIFLNPPHTTHVRPGTETLTTMTLLPTHGDHRRTVNWSAPIPATTRFKPRHNEFAIVPIREDGTPSAPSKLRATEIRIITEN